VAQVIQVEPISNDKSQLLASNPTHAASAFGGTDSHIARPQVQRFISSF
jgi:hypothetical protein